MFAIVPDLIADAASKLIDWLGQAASARSS
jgi:hypothetical protein